jgi:hypothetical protein
MLMGHGASSSASDLPTCSATTDTARCWPAAMIDHPVRVAQPTPAAPIGWTREQSPRPMGCLRSQVRAAISPPDGRRPHLGLHTRSTLESPRVGYRVRATTGVPETHKTPHRPSPPSPKRRDRTDRSVQRTTRSAPSQPERQPRTTSGDGDRGAGQCIGASELENRCVRAPWGGDRCAVKPFVNHGF